MYERNPESMWLIVVQAAKVRLEVVLRKINLHCTDGC